MVTWTPLLLAFWTENSWWWPSGFIATLLTGRPVDHWNHNVFLNFIRIRWLENDCPYLETKKFDDGSPCIHHWHTSRRRDRRLWHLSECPRSDPNLSPSSFEERSKHHLLFGHQAASDRSPTFRFLVSIREETRKSLRRVIPQNEQWLAIYSTVSSNMASWEIASSGSEMRKTSNFKWCKVVPPR